MKTERTLAYVNLFSVLGTLRFLCEEVPEAKKLADVKKLSVGFRVKGGPEGTLTFDRGNVTMKEGTEGAAILLPFSSPEQFNRMIDGTYTPIPLRGFTHISFLTKNFMALTTLLSDYLRPKEEHKPDEPFFRVSTTLLLHVITEAVAQIGNEDAIGQASNSYIPEGIAALEIGDELSTGIRKQNGKLAAIHTRPEQASAKMRFESLALASDLFGGKINAVTAVGLGQVRVSGLIPMVDNINRILDRVSVYLA